MFLWLVFWCIFYISVFILYYSLFQIYHTSYLNHNTRIIAIKPTSNTGYNIVSFMALAIYPVHYSNTINTLIEIASVTFGALITFRANAKL